MVVGHELSICSGPAGSAKEYERREELESKKGLALERRKQVADTAEMDRNLARVSAYGAKIRSTLRQIKQTIQPGNARINRYGI